MPNSTFVAISQEEQAQMPAALRRARYGYLLSLHILLLCATGHNPTAIAAVLFCSCSSVYRTVRAYRAGALGLECDAQGRLVPSMRTAVLLPTLRRSLLALLKVPPRAYGWCRTRWSCATLALTLQTTRGLAVSAETMRRWLREIGWVWKRAKLVAKDDDPQRVDRLAHIRFVYEPLPRGEAMVFADELDIHLLPKVGYAWMPRGTQLAVMTPARTRSTTWLARSIWPPARCTTASGRATRTPCSVLCAGSSMSIIPPSSIGASMSSWITLSSIKPGLVSNGWRPTRA
jgi:transposase